ncbi:MAG: hypothetical protein CVU40_09770 [Chloroflexi bacterium HGW-Chloroflexi-2]|nr:MAG: hypothetical protein CVU40_09770 [Chloroflexi bacterium HGW-Chloroflexi-2]
MEDKCASLPRRRFLYLCDLSAFLAKINQKDLATIKELLETGKVKPVTDRTYPLRETAEALRYLDEGHAQGKIIVTVEH